MAYTETGFKRSMKITITKTGNDGSVINTTYDGQGEFIYNGTTYTAIASDDDFRRLERNGANGDWDIRLNAFKKRAKHSLIISFNDTGNIISTKTAVDETRKSIDNINK